VSSLTEIQREALEHAARGPLLRTVGGWVGESGTRTLTGFTSGTVLALIGKGLLEPDNREHFWKAKLVTITVLGHQRAQEPPAEGRSAPRAEGEAS
jgi:hypothetical protein